MDMDVEYTAAHAEFHDDKVRIIFEGRVLFDGNMRDGMVVQSVLQRLLEEHAPDASATVMEVPSEEAGKRILANLKSTQDCTKVL